MRDELRDGDNDSLAWTLPSDFEPGAVALEFRDRHPPST
jgi:hypothetical protein